MYGSCWVFFSRRNRQGPDKLVSGPGSTLTENKCKICHELQHIRRTLRSRGEWADNLKNMRERGTPMSDEEQAVILDRLSVHYGRDPGPAPSPDTLAGGQGAWGQVPMPPTAAIPDTELSALIGWVPGQK